MFVDFFFQLREARIPATIREFLVLLEGMEKGVAGASVDDFYYLARATLVKDEKYFDAFDKVFGNFFQGAMNAIGDLFDAKLPEEWLRALADRMFTDEEKEKLSALSFEELMEELTKRLQEQEKQHKGGSKWIGTGGTSPFGNSGYNPAGVRIGGKGGQGRATKVWEKREFKGLDGNVELGTRNIKVALRKLRKFVRDGAEDEFDLDGTIQATAHNGGYLDIKMVPERKNRIKVLLFLDIGGSMDPFIRVSEEMFSAARSEFKHLESYYFHNFLYERVWREPRRGYREWTPTWDILNTYSSDYKVIFIGDATMSPFEVTEIGGSIEHWNDESGETWLRRLLAVYPDTVWLNPVRRDRWMQTPSLRVAHQIMGGRMYPLTTEGLEQAMKALRSRTPVLRPGR